MFTIGGTSNRGFYPFEPTGSLRFEDGDSPYLTRTPTTAGNLKTWTFSCWIKRGNISEQSNIFNPYYGGDGSNESQFYFHSDDSLRIYDSGALRLDAKTSALFRDASAWYHIVLRVDTTQATDSDRLRIYVNGEEATIANGGNGGPTYPTQNQTLGWNGTSAHYVGSYRGSNHYLDGYMAEIYHVDGTSHDADTFGETKNGVWMPKDAKSSLTFGTNGFYLPFNSTVTAEGQSTVLYEGTSSTRAVEGMGYKPDLLWIKGRDNTAHALSHHLLDRVRGPSNWIASDRYQAAQDYGDRVQSFNSDGFTLGSDSSNAVNDSGDRYVAWAWDAGADQTPTGFGCVTYTGSASLRPVRDVGFNPDLVWVKKREDTDGYHSLFDTVRGPRKVVFTNVTNAQDTENASLQSFDDDGFTIDSWGGANESGKDFVAWCWDAGDGDAVSNTDGDITSTVKASDTHGFSIGTFTKGSGTQTVGHGLSAAPDWLIVKRYSGGTGSWAVYHSANTANPETDYLRLNSTNGTADDATFWGDTAPTSSVFSVGSAFNSGEELLFYAWTEKSGYSKFTSYTGNGSATGPSVTLGFRPAFLMVKRTDVGAEDWNVFDTTRQPSNGHFGTRLFPNTAAAETNVGDELIEITSTGFQIKTTAGSLNSSGGTYIVMAFAGGIDTIAPVNTDGDIDSRVKASDDTGFSIVRYEGTGTAGDTVGHGLSSAPDVIAVKALNQAYDWLVYHSGMDSTAPEDYWMSFNLTDARTDQTAAWNDTAPTSSVFSVGSGGNTNGSGVDLIAYCWTATTGKSAFGSYTGNGSASGPSVTGLGFKPAMLIIKRADAADNWIMHDIMRDNYDTLDDRLYANLSNAEASGGDYGVDLDSDGFTVATADSGWNANGGTYLYMAFADGRDASFFHDESGQGNNFEPENLQNYDVVPDSPTNGFCTMNPLDKNNGSYAEGNLKATTGTVGGSTQRATYYVSSGKWYYEFQPTSNGGITAVGFESLSGGSYSSHMYQADNGQYYNGSSASSYGATYGNSDIIGIALDADNQTVEFFKNGVSQGELSSSNSGMTAGDEYVPFLSDRNVSQTMTGIFNFGQDDSFAGTVTPGGYTDANERGAFKYPVPDGFLSLCTANLPETDISPANGQEPADYFNTALWTADVANPAAGDKSINLGFEPGLVWSKNRNNAEAHYWVDSVRGDNATNKWLKSNRTDAEGGDAIGNTTAKYDFTSTGFDIIDSDSTSGEVYYTNRTYVGWGWAAGGTAVSNTDGSITSSVSANTKAGFSIVSWDGDGASAGATVGHGLDSAPELILPKNRGTTGNWHSYHSALGATKGILLNSTNAASTDSGFWNDTEPTSSVFTVGTYNVFNNDYIAYCFHSVPGYSKVGSYTGNGSSDGVFVHCGFRPAFILGKSSSSAGDNWFIFDNKRDTENVAGKDLNPDSSAAEADSDLVDFLSNGFKWRASSGLVNDSTTFIFYAVAEQPFKYAQAR
jgi:hypothetical protein